jgi:hypothetical protein
MRSSAWSSLAISACSAALVVAGPARAHIDATPAFLVVDGTETISLTAHNDRAVPMDGFAVTASAGLRIEDVGELEGWTGSTDGMTATWTGNRLAAEDAGTFSVVLEAPSAPGPVSLQAEQRYPDGGALTWPVPLTVVPADESSSTGAWVYAVVAVGLLLAAMGVALAWRRRDAR